MQQSFISGLTACYPEAEQKQVVCRTCWPSPTLKSYIQLVKWLRAKFQCTINQNSIRGTTRLQVWFCSDNQTASVGGFQCFTLAHSWLVVSLSSNSHIFLSPNFHCACTETAISEFLVEVWHGSFIRRSRFSIWYGYFGDC